VNALAAAGGGFLLAVLWFDLMFDVQTLAHREPQLPEEVLASIASYYRRVTTAARPMNRLIALAMLATIVALVLEIVDHHGPLWVRWASLAIAIPPIGLAAMRTVPSAVRLGTRCDSAQQQSQIARSICRQHIFCATAIAALLVLQLTLA
jgi:hypothetical protein